jgi:hypothetical protein
MDVKNCGEVRCTVMMSDNIYLCAIAARTDRTLAKDRRREVLTGPVQAAGGASLLLPLHISAAVAKHLARLAALHIPQAAAAAWAGLVPEDNFVGLFGLSHLGSFVIGVPFPSNRAATRNLAAFYLCAIAARTERTRVTVKPATIASKPTGAAALYVSAISGRVCPTAPAMSSTKHRNATEMKKQITPEARPITALRKNVRIRVWLRVLEQPYVRMIP